MNFNRNDILNIFIGVIIIFALIIFIDVVNLNLNPKQTDKKVIQVVNIEGLTSKKGSSKPKKDTSEPKKNTSKPNKTTTTVKKVIPNTVINLNPIIDFCKSSSDSLKESCAKLTKTNCNATSCCVLLNGEKCVAGNKDGPTFKTESGKNVNVDYYYYQNKCYGNKCK